MVENRDADAVVRVVVTDRSIESARSLPGAEQLAYVDPGGGYRPAAVFLLPPPDGAAAPTRPTALGHSP